MKKMLFIVIASTIVFFTNTQLLSWSPPFPKEDDVSQTLVITLDATKGNQELLNYSPTNDVYLHTGTPRWIKISSGDNSHLIAVSNFNVSNHYVSVTFPDSGTCYDYLENTTYASTGTLQTIQLARGEFHVFLNRNINTLTPTPIIKVVFNENELQAKAYPNPASTDFTLELNLLQSSKMQIDVYTTLGRYLDALLNGFVSKGTHQLALKKKTILNGNYYLKVTSKNAIKTV